MPNSAGLFIMMLEEKSIKMKYFPPTFPLYLIAENWMQRKNVKIPIRFSPEWYKEYEKWVKFAFRDKKSQKLWKLLK